MFIELAEFLRCPQAHDDPIPCIVVPDAMRDRHVVRGSVACPVCGRTYPILDGVVRFGHVDDAGATKPLPPAETVRALLGLSGPGGNVVLIGSAAALGPALAGGMGGVHFVGVNAPVGVHPGPDLSLLQHESTIPLASSMARGVVLGAEHTAPPWPGEAARVLLRGLRLVALHEGVEVPGVERRAVGQGMWVGEKVAGRRG